MFNEEWLKELQDLNAMIVNKEKLEALQKKYNFTEEEIGYLFNFEKIRRKGKTNMYEYLVYMIQNDANGGEKLANWIKSNYGEFVDVIVCYL